MRSLSILSSTPRAGEYLPVRARQPILIILSYFFQIPQDRDLTSRSTALNKAAMSKWFYGKRWNASAELTAAITSVWSMANLQFSFHWSQQKYLPSRLESLETQQAFKNLETLPILTTGQESDFHNTIYAAQKLPSQNFLCFQQTTTSSISLLVLDAASHHPIWKSFSWPQSSNENKKCIWLDNLASAIMKIRSERQQLE